MTELCKTRHRWRDYIADVPLFQCQECQALGRRKGKEIALVQCVECGGVATGRTIRSRKIVPICESCRDKPCDVHQAWSPFRGRQDWFACDRCGLVGRQDRPRGAFVPAQCATCGEPATMVNDGTDEPSCFDHFLGILIL
jgi:hypothetical protein